ncbi:MAG: zinc transporter ZupT [Eubacteriales bacterium]|nr:zinc transporter ZupT [Eubacteriales bacterium]
MEGNILTAILISFLVGLTTSIGGALAFFLKRDSMKVLAIGLSFSAGVMIFVSFMEILPAAIDFFTTHLGATKGKLVAIIIFFFGIALAALIDYFMPDHVTNDMIDDDQKVRLKRVGVFTAIAIAIHNFPEGLATFMAGLNSFSLSIPIAVAIALHNIPEGISVALPIYNATGKKRKAFLWAFVAGMAEPLGAIIGFVVLINILNDYTFGASFALIAGIMIYLALDELLPMAKEYDEGHQGIIGVSLGMLVMAMTTLFFEI